VNGVIRDSIKHTTIKNNLLTSDEVKIAENLLVVLKPFKEITNMLSHSKMTNSQILPSLFFILDEIQENHLDNKELSQIKTFMRACLDFYECKYGLIENVLLIAASYLDPRTKNFEFTDGLAKFTKEEFKNKAKDFLKNRANEFNLDKESVSEKSNQTSSSQANNKTENNFSNFMSRKAQNNKTPSKTGTATTLEEEIKIYDTIEADLDFSEFWYTHKSKLPKLTTLVMSICCGPPTTVASENDFSMGADIIWPKRNKLSDKRLHCISFIKRNLSRHI
jgi:hypothetical protein